MSALRKVEGEPEFILQQTSNHRREIVFTLSASGGFESSSESSLGNVDHVCQSLLEARCESKGDLRINTMPDLRGTEWAFVLRRLLNYIYISL